MEDRKLVEKQAQRLGLGTVTTQWSPLGTPTALNDALLTGSVDLIGVGLPGFLTLWDKTRGNLNVMAVAGLNPQPPYLKHRKPQLQICLGFPPKGRIPVPPPQ